MASKGLITLLRLVVTAPKGWFYPQDWYYDEEFANTPLIRSYPGPGGSGMYGSPVLNTAVFLLANYYKQRQTDDWLSKTYYWTDDKDDAGNRVYIGGWDLGKMHKGLQIHRHLADPLVKEIPKDFFSQPW